MVLLTPSIRCSGLKRVSDQFFVRRRGWRPCRLNRRITAQPSSFWRSAVVPASNFHGVVPGAAVACQLCVTGDSPAPRNGGMAWALRGGPIHPHAGWSGHILVPRKHQKVDAQLPYVHGKCAHACAPSTVPQAFQPLRRWRSPCTGLIAASPDVC